VLVAHACNPSYSGGRDQEDHGSKPAQENSSRELISKILNTKQPASGVAQVGRVPSSKSQGPEFKPQYCQKIMTTIIPNFKNQRKFQKQEF
jgi:hypothetical protein